ncbi:MAG TPA: phenylalanine--tRNA ligase subunit alpha [Phycisphaerae bacterium]|nr:phenylalanine--tRNA ligase subunit alpha [Phycisphaerae bacterium]HNU46023.1 phenylalanine--tRNA ligase subunit alpha [Phycisphaerae bacterium]
MDIEQLGQRIAEIEAAVVARLPSVANVDDLRRVENEVLGKEGALGALITTIKEYPPAQRGQVGQVINAAKGRVKAALDGRRAALEAAVADAEAAAAAAFDPTLPGYVEPMGSVHPVTAVQWRIERLFERLGFTVEAGPEMEEEYYNFEALNIPATHPARDMQDTFWLTNRKVLRTQTSPVQVRAMLKYGAPLRIIAPGRCFRYETIDASHENTFHQVEGLMIDREISIPNLIALAHTLLREVMERDVKVRVRPGFFPFVEPGLEIDMNCQICAGKGCPTCKQSGWIEVLPCGMVHPNVLLAGKVDPHEFSGFAFGLGLTRLAMMKYGIGDIRVLNSGDLRPIVAARRLEGPVVAAV